MDPQDRTDRTTTTSFWVNSNRRKIFSKKREGDSKIKLMENLVGAVVDRDQQQQRRQEEEKEGRRRRRLGSRPRAEQRRTRRRGKGRELRSRLVYILSSVLSVSEIELD